jgi:hypothetical protein
LEDFLSKKDVVVVNYLDVDNPEEKIFKIVPLKIHRDWMQETDDKFAYKCLPLNIANQYGWSVLAPFDFKVAWNGGKVPGSVEIFNVPQKYKNTISSHFGNATFTINLDFIIKTPKEYSLYIRGVPNKDYGILTPLDAIVETDWLPFTFTYNFKFSDTGIVEFREGEELFSFFPIKRDSVENFSITAKSIKDDPDLMKDYIELSRSRDEALLKQNPENKYEFQRFYIDGKSPSKTYDIINHIKRIFFKDIA